MLGLHPPEQGELEVLGLDPTTAGPDVRERVGYSPEHHSLPPDVKAVDFVRHIAELHGLPRREATGRASDVLWQVGLGEERVRPIGTMSTGQRQRVKLAQAIVHDPVLVLLDEPTEGLDPVQRDEMLRLIRRVGSEFGIHIVLSSHVLDEVERVADNAVILHAGQVVAVGPARRAPVRRRGMVVEIDGDVRPLANHLERQGATLHWDGVRLYVSGDGDVHLPRARRVARAAPGRAPPAAAHAHPRGGLPRCRAHRRPGPPGAGRSGRPRGAARAELAARLAAGRNGGVPR